MTFYTVVWDDIGVLFLFISELGQVMSNFYDTCIDLDNYTVTLIFNSI